MGARIAYNNFTGGEVSPTLNARYNLERFANFSQAMQNMRPGLHGDCARRPGTRFVADLGEFSVLIPFSFNADTANNFTIVLSDKKFRVSNGKNNLSAAIATPYAAADLLAISWAQVGDVVYLAHPAYTLHKILRQKTATPGLYAWSIVEVVLNQSIAAPATPTVTFSASGSYPLRYKVVAIDAAGKESLPSAAGECSTGKHPSDWVQGNSASVSWTAVPGAKEYNVYRESAGYFGFIGISTRTSFTDNNYEAKTDDTPKEDWDPFANGNNPGVVAFHQQRMVLTGCAGSPGYFYLSRTGDFESFRKSRPLQDDDPVEYQIASGAINAVTWAASFGDLLLGTTGSEYKATGDNGIITPKISYVTAQSYWGSAGLAPLIIGNSVLHVQRHGSRVRDLFYSLEKDGYAGNDLSIFAPHLFDGHTLKQWAYQQTPGSTIWCVRDDGLLLALTYMKEHDIWGWSRHVTDGDVLSVATISGDSGDAVLLIVRRTVAGQTRYFLERLADPFQSGDDIAEAYFVDCGVSQRSAEPTHTVTGLGHLEGRTLAVLADGSPVEGCVVSGGQITIPYAAKVVHAGLPYTSILSPLPMEAQAQTGVTLGKKRAYGKCLVRLFRSVGGKYGADLDHLDDFPFIPTNYGEPCEPFTGDREFTPGGGQSESTSVWLVQDKPLPWQVVAIMCDVDFGQV